MKWLNASTAFAQYENVYMPVIQVIRDTNMIRKFPEKTEGDLYLRVLAHQRIWRPKKASLSSHPRKPRVIFLEMKMKSQRGR